MKLSRFALIVEDHSPFELVRIMSLGGALTGLLEARDAKGRLLQVTIMATVRELKDARFPEDVITTRTKHAVASMHERLNVPWRAGKTAISY